MLVEVDLSAIVADMEDGGGAGGGDHHDGQVVVTYGSQDPYEIVRPSSIGLLGYIPPAPPPAHPHNSLQLDVYCACILVNILLKSKYGVLWTSVCFVNLWCTVRD